MTKIPQSWEGRIKHSFIKNDNYEDMADFGKNAQLVKDVNTSFEVKSISAESVSISAGAAGTTGVCAPKYRGIILNANGIFAGKVDDTSVVITSTALTREVAYNDSITTTAMFDSMSNGDFAINYYTGEIYYKKEDASVSFTMDYKVPLLVSGISVGTLQVDDINVSAFKNQAGTQKDAKVNGADILVIQTGSGNDATTMDKEIATENTLTNVLNSLTLDEKAYDTIELTYVAPGNDGAGEVETVVYKDGLDTIYTLTLAYNSDNKLISVTRS